jgi:hypothetical protein
MLRMQSRQKEKELQKVKGVRDIVPDLDKWPKSWMGTKSDFEYGKKLLPFMEKFINYLVGQDLSRKTLKEYIDNVWLLGGTIIKHISIYEEHKRDALEVILEDVEADGCLPDGYDCMSKSELASFSRMCRKFEEFLKNIAEGSQR